MKLFDNVLARVERSLDVRLLRHGVLAGNLANLDTPGYKPKDVDFSAAMSEASAAGATDLRRTDEQHFDVNGGSVGATVAANRDDHLRGVRVVENGGVAPSLDQNQVDLDKTMAALTENAMQYGASAKAASKKLAMLRYAASDGQG